jgi:hypothetical protein
MKTQHTPPAHTPTPWTVSPAIWTGARSIRANGGLLHIGWASCRDDRDAPQDKAVTQANAAFIVQACNSHEKLIEALDYLLQQTVDMDLSLGFELAKGEKEAREKAIAAIAEARGE